MAEEAKNLGEKRLVRKKQDSNIQFSLTFYWFDFDTALTVSQKEKRTHDVRLDIL
jgi:uncharacterized protein YcfL